ncbi:hypothetical protein J4402_01990 [Candidatus Pacearchaeota archaeon]|nr:hypothetical protein [uncultured archaeon]AQS31832.1 hypothetical protein [uncultured archaeon]MBS3088528.1 hypothetical protein [Candidatus Pacearchaeota archaeon]
MNKEGILILIALILLPAVSAEIISSQPSSQYNVGDQFNLTIELISSTDTRAFFISTLVCDGREVEIYKSPFTLKQGDKKTIKIELSLDKFLIGDSQGQCSIKSTYDTEEAVSYSFEITSNIDTIINMEGINFNPGEEVKASGQAVKSNGQLLDGLVEISFSETGLHYANEVKAGKFDFNFTLPDNIRAGLHDLEVSAYEKDSYGEIINYGNTSTTIKVNQIPKKIELEFSANTVVPGNELTYTVLVADQAGNLVEEDVAVVVYKPDESVFEKKLAKVNKPISIATTSVTSPGYWKIESTMQELTTSRIFYVEELEQASFLLANTTLRITNTGNVPYEKPIEVSFGGIKEITDIKLKLNESKEIRLVAPDGEYEIQVGDGVQNANFGTVALTGNAIALKDTGKIIAGSIWLWLWILIIIMLAAIAVVLIRRYVKNKNKVRGISPIKVNVPSSSKESASNVIDKGEKQESSIVVLKLKNLEELNKFALQAVDSALWKAKDSKAKIYSDSNYRIIIFSQLLTKTKENDYKAISLAQTLERTLEQYNKHSQQKINFGIGVHNGELIVESKDGKFKFTSLGTAITLPKRISSHANSEVLLSEVVHRKTSAKVKAEKIHNANLWKIKRIIDRSQHEEYINKFMKKQHEK